MRVPLTRIAPRSEDGFTLIEVLAAMIIGMVVLMGAFTVLDNTTRLTTNVRQRVDSLQRGRNALDLMTRDLRSQVCVGLLTNATTGTTTTDPSLRGGSDSSVDFYTDLGDGSKNADGTDKYPPTRRTLTFDATAKTIVEQIYTPTGRTGAYVYPATPLQTRTLLADVVQDGSTPVFRFYAYDTSVTPPTPTALLNASPALSDTDEQRTVRIAIAFKTLRSGGTATSSGSSVLQDDVFRRAVNPNRSTLTPECAA
jgi:prepilin-type N-terminal cleavage/methylation domain-containing protein